MLEEKDVWGKSWESHIKRNPADILNSRITRETYQVIASFIDSNDKLILEAGCGSGRLCCLLANDLPASRIIGFDLSETSISLANTLKENAQAANVAFEMGDLFKIAYPDNHFDVVFNDGVIEHFALEESPNYIDALREMKRVTKPGGKVVVCVPNWYCFAHTLYKWALQLIGKPYKYGYEKSFRHSELIKLFMEHGFEEIEISAFYPGHSFYYFAGRGGNAKLFLLLGKLTDLIAAMDFTADRKFTKRFGIAIVVKGVKR